MSVPWPLLLVLVWERSHSPGLLGATAAARMVPYVACSWWVARIGDRVGRDRVVRASIVARLALLVLVAVALAAHQPLVAVLLATASIAAATPAYPALAASMPAVAGRDTARVTDLLVTIEVSGFMVGPALGGLLLAVPLATMPVTVGATAAAYLLMRGLSLRAAGGSPPEARPLAPGRRSLGHGQRGELGHRAGLGADPPHAGVHGPAERPRRHGGPDPPADGPG